MPRAAGDADLTDLFFAFSLLSRTGASGSYTWTVDIAAGTSVEYSLNDRRFKKLVEIRSKTKTRSRWLTFKTLYFGFTDHFTRNQTGHLLHQRWHWNRKLQLCSDDSKWKRWFLSQWLFLIFELFDFTRRSIFEQLCRHYSLCCEFYRHQFIHEGIFHLYQV